MDINKFLNDKNNFLLYPQTFDSANIIAFLIVKYFTGKEITIFSEYKDNINNALPVNLPDDFYVHPKDTNILGNVLSKSDNILLIEDIELFMNSASNMNIYSNLFIIGTFGISSNNISYLELIKANILRLNIAYMGPTIKYNILSRNIRELLLNITLLDGRQILYMNDMDILDDIETYLIEIKKQYYVIDEGCSDIYKDNISKEFKNNTLLIITTKIDTEYKNIETIHFFDIYDDNNYMINKVYKRRLYSKYVDTLNIYYYIDNSNNLKYKSIKSNNEVYKNNYYTIYNKSKVIL